MLSPTPPRVPGGGSRVQGATTSQGGDDGSRTATPTAILPQAALSRSHARARRNARFRLAAAPAGARPRPSGRFCAGWGARSRSGSRAAPRGTRSRAYWWGGTHLCSVNIRQRLNVFHTSARGGQLGAAVPPSRGRSPWAGSGLGLGLSPPSCLSRGFSLDVPRRAQPRGEMLLRHTAEARSYLTSDFWVVGRLLQRAWFIPASHTWLTQGKYF